MKESGQSMSIPAFYAVGLLTHTQSTFAIGDFWRFWVVHLWDPALAQRIQERVGAVDGPRQEDRVHLPLRDALQDRH